MACVFKIVCKIVSIYNAGFAAPDFHWVIFITKDYSELLAAYAAAL